MTIQEAINPLPREMKNFVLRQFESLNYQYTEVKNLEELLDSINRGLQERLKQLTFRHNKLMQVKQIVNSEPIVDVPQETIVNNINTTQGGDNAKAA